MEVIKNEESSNQIKNGAIMSYITIIFNIISGLVYTPWLVSKIGMSDYGIFTLSVSMIGLFVMDFGLGAAVSRFISKYTAEGAYDKIRDFLGVTLKLYILIDIIILIVLISVFGCINSIYTELNPLEIQKLKIVFCISGFFSIISFPFIPLNGILVANEKFVFIKKCELLNKIGTIVLMILALSLGYGLYAVVIVNVVVGVLITILKVKYVIKETNIEINLKCRERKIMKEIFNFSLWTTVMNIAGRLIMNITPTILGALSGANQISIFSIGMTIEGYVFTFANALNGLFLPKVSKIITYKDGNEDIEKLMIKVGRIQLFVVGIILVGFITLGKDFISLWMGEDFKDSYWVSVFLIIPCFITLTQEIANTMVVAANKVKERSIIHIFTAIISLSLSLTLSQKYGAVGSAFAIGLSIFIGNVIIVNYFYYKNLNINIIKFFRNCHLNMCMPIIISSIVGILIQKYIFTSGWIIFIAKVIALSIIYFVLMWHMALNEYEKNIVTRIFK